MSERVLNGERAAELWEAVKDRSLPVKALTRAEYEALTEEAKQADVVYLVDEPRVEPLPLSIQEYDTEDGWHVRKYSDGYVEFDAIFDHTILAADWGQWGSIYSVGVTKVKTYSYPLTLVQLYGETFDITWPIPGAIAILHGNRDDNGHTKHYGFCRGTALDADYPVKLHYHVTGRWK